MIRMDKPTGRQIAAARTLVGMTQSELAERSKVSVPTVKRMEGSEGPAVGMANNVDAVCRALETAGVEFIPENGGGAGVRLRKAHG
ncbi:helix-turn-helix transcriptional regulator [Mesorhizobium sp. Ld1326N3]|uniref:Helix-turn-helix transcriptional regulator n=2 Tax=Mesorhizobium salmacidum TaxID=3015171 RepID=A0ABU8L7A6_9HYPH